MSGLPSTHGFLLPARYIPYVANTAAAVSIVPIAAGLLGIMRPRSCLNALEFPPPGPTDSPTAGSSASAATASKARVIEALTKMYAVRQFGMGVATIVAWWYGAYRVIGMNCLAAGVLTAGVDAVVAREVVGHQVWGHWVGVGLAVVFGTTLTGIL